MSFSKRKGAMGNANHKYPWEKQIFCDFSFSFNIIAKNQINLARSVWCFSLSLNATFIVLREAFTNYNYWLFYEIWLLEWSLAMWPKKSWHFPKTMNYEPSIFGLKASLSERKSDKELSSFSLVARLISEKKIWEEWKPGNEK